MKVEIHIWPKHSILYFVDNGKTLVGCSKKVRQSIESLKKTSSVEGGWAE